MRGFVRTALTALLPSAVMGIKVDFSSPSSIKSASSTLAYELMSNYKGNLTGQIPGELPPPYYWWECGAMFGCMIDYWYYTGDPTYNDVVSQGLQFQTGQYYDYMPPNQTKDEGNDDQLFWAFSVMTAAEYKFPNPPDTMPGWVALAQAVFNSQALRWDNSTCNGGLHWQIFQFNNGYDYKNSPSNIGFMNLGSRLFAYTGNTTYQLWVNTMWDWVSGVGLISPEWDVFDGTTPSQNCTSLDHVQWSYSAGMAINAAAVMWNVTQDEVWKDRATNLWKRSAEVFFKDGILYEVACEPQSNCDLDQLSFKSYFTRFVADSTKRAPWMTDMVSSLFSTSATAAAEQCDGGSNGETCGYHWLDGSTWDGTQGVGQQMCALQIFGTQLLDEVSGPVSGKTGGISKSNATLGTGGDKNPTIILTPISTSDRAGAGIITALVLIGMAGGTWWLVA